MDKYSHPEIEKLMRGDNRVCFDCGVPSPKWASVNNAVYVCLQCAGVHRGLGVHISFIRSLTMDNWDEKQIKFLKQGGNQRMRMLLEEYGVPLNTDIELKYRLIAVDVHRKTLRAEINNEYPPEKPDLITGIETMDDGIKKNQNFDNSNFLSNPTVEKQESKGFFSKVGGFFQKTAGQLGEKIKEMKISQKFDKTAIYLDKKTKQVIKSQFVQNIVDKTKNAFGIKAREESSKNEDIGITENAFDIDTTKSNNSKHNEFPELEPTHNASSIEEQKMIEDFFSKGNSGHQPIDYTNLEPTTKKANLIDYDLVFK